MKLKHIDIFLHPTSQYGVLAHFSKKLEVALQRAKIQVKMFHPDEMDAGDIFTHLQENPPDCTLGFNLIMPEDAPFTSLGIPHVSVLVDWATYYPELIKATNSIAACVDRASCELFSTLGQKNVLFFPHAVEPEIFSEDIFESKRDLEVVFSGTYIDEEEVVHPWKEKLSKKAFDLMDTLAEKTIESTSKPHIAFFHDDEVMHELKEKQINIFNYFTVIDLMARARDRIRLVQAVDGPELHIFGAKGDDERWKKHLKGKKSVVFHDPCSFEDLFKIFLRSKYVLHSAPMHKVALHERLLYAASFGATVIANKTDYLEQSFPNEEGLHYYIAPNYKEINTHFGQDEQERLAEVSSLRKQIQKEHTWDQRVKLLQKELPELLVNITHNRTVRSIQPLLDS